MTTPLFSATSSSPRQILLLLRCLASTKKALVRISPEGLRFSTDEGSTLESYLVLSRNLFTTYTYNPAPPPSSQDDPPDPPTFEINLNALLETLNIFSLSDPSTYSNKRGGEDAFASHRLGRHAGINAFASRGTLGVTGLTTFSYDGPGSAFGIHMSESGVTTTSELTTYEAEVGGGEEIPFNREDLGLKTIMRASALLDAVTELSSLTPSSLCVSATPTSSRLGSSAANLSLSAAGSLGEARVDFSTTTSSETPVLETFQCQRRVSSHYRFSAVKSATRAMAAATKVSVRMDGEGVLSLQFLVEVDGGGEEGVAFVDFRVVPLVEGEIEDDGGGEGESDSD
ncbi:checkpoint clamp complex protein Rad1 [Elasticomyces elasticus]|nr:checkpoint clamp complex protein Rad1 [Elasticomyces elasticus]KAK3653444.1 checkpoint clamp complex protein Rad1 [Elasticomyces elasticus]KAK4925988.1 checkpoint clamp complex protein Rad1 [Elasticomyces elasticus]KAK5768224.1 checkpoint clamp complex protein Rad1 [Elasticomyces elasticus]